MQEVPFSTRGSLPPTPPESDAGGYYEDNVAASTPAAGAAAPHHLPPTSCAHTQSIDEKLKEQAGLSLARANADAPRPAAA